jgi:Zn-dependent peptidase ImmA (M78 family)/DNA-binding XRE family transcriptional regulator
MVTPTDLTKKRENRHATSPDSDLTEAAAVAEMFDGSRLTQARHFAGLTKRALAEQVDVSAAAIGQYESGTIRPRPELIVKLAGALSVPMRFFAFAVLRPKAQVDASMAHFRSLRSMRSYERERAVAFVRQIIEITQALERRVKLPRLEVPSGLNAGQDEWPVPAEPGAAARWIRRRWRLGSDPIPHMVRLLESKGVVVTLLPFSDAGRVNAFSFYGQGRPIIVLTTDKDDVYRHRFTAAHELGHVLMHRDAQPGDVQHEREANAFAAELLMPSASIASQLPARPDFRTYASLQAAWGVSIDALIYRSRELGLLSDASYKRAWQRLGELRANGLVRSEPIGYYPGESPVLLRRALKLAAERGFGLDALAKEMYCLPDLIQQLIGESAQVSTPVVNVVDMASRRPQKEEDARVNGIDGTNSVDQMA